MDFSVLIDWAQDLYASYPIFCYALGAVLLLLLLWKPARVLKIIFLAAVLMALIYGLVLLTDTITSGVKVKEGGLQKTQKALE